MTTPDIEVGRLGLRTFSYSVIDETLGSLFFRKEGDWMEGTAVSRCDIIERRTQLRGQGWNVWTGPDSVPLTVPAHQDGPYMDCRCGIYAATNLYDLYAQYTQTMNLVTVVAVEGKTIIGDTGMRSTAARVIAYWVAPRIDDEDVELLDPGEQRKKYGHYLPNHKYRPAIYAAAQRQFKDAKEYVRLAEMLSAHDLPWLPPEGADGFVGYLATGRVVRSGDWFNEEFWNRIVARGEYF